MPNLTSLSLRCTSKLASRRRLGPSFFSSSPPLALSSLTLQNCPLPSLAALAPLQASLSHLSLLESWSLESSLAGDLTGFAALTSLELDLAMLGRVG